MKDMNIKLIPTDKEKCAKVTMRENYKSGTLLDFVNDVRKVAPDGQATDGIYHSLAQAKFVIENQYPNEVTNEYFRSGYMTAVTDMIRLKFDWFFGDGEVVYRFNFNDGYGPIDNIPTPGATRDVH